MSQSLSPESSPRRRYLLIIVVAALTILIDQISKQLILNSFRPGEILPIIPGFFNLTLTFNFGAAFGLWSNLPPGWREFALGASITLALTVLFFFLRHSAQRSALSQVSLAAVLGGALGNVLDRIQHGYVIDFLDAYWGNYHWPAFNVADSAIVVGVAIVVLGPQYTPAPDQHATPSDGSSKIG
jgi:signal peptidase II